MHMLISRLMGGENVTTPLGEQPHRSVRHKGAPSNITRERSGLDLANRRTLPTR